MNSNFPEAPPATKLHYVDGRAASITLRRCRLEVPRGGGQFETLTFDKDVITIGATSDNDVILEDETVSRNHCRIFIEGDRYMVRDLNSTNGTFVSRVRVREAWLKPDCVLTLGKTELRFLAVDEQIKVVPSQNDRFGEIIGGDQQMREIYGILEKIAPTDATVVIEGETGTGKEVFARSIHRKSRRADGPFVVFDCGAVPENLIESELFGHEKGSFTGAIGTRRGIFEMADGGTVFLDELGELQIDLQPKLLRVLEQREVKRVGGSRPIHVDVRVVAATNRRLEKEVREGRFREDLFYRLSVVRLELPPLRARRSDIGLLLNHFLEHSQFNKNREGGTRITGIAPEALEVLIRYSWPGNVRELHNVVERAVSFSDSTLVQIQDLPDHVVSAAHQGGFMPMIPAPNGGTMAAVRPPVNGTFKDVKEQWVASFERDYIEQLLKRNDGNISHAAREADIDRKYFRKLMKKYGISADDIADDDVD